MNKILSICAYMLLVLPLAVNAEEITIVGTGSGPPILKEIGEAFSQQNPGVRIVLPRSIGSGGGIKTVGNDDYLLGRVARKIKPNEKKYGLTYLPIARMPIVFYANSNVAVKNLTNEQVLGIYSGKHFNWKEMGGHNARIRVIRRQDGDSSLNVLLKQFPNFKDITLTEFSKTTHSDPDTIALTEKTPDTIAFGSYSDVMGHKVNIFNLDGVSPASPSYPYYGISGLVFKEANRKGRLKKFIDFAASPAAEQAIKKGGGLPMQN